MSKPLKVLDLFSGLRGWSAPFAARGHETFAIDLAPHFDADAHIDCGDVDLVLRTIPWRPDVILASPPCTAFTTMTMGRNWTHEGQPKSPRAVEGQRLVLATVRIIAALRPEWGLIADLTAPDLETRIAILRAKAEDQGVPVGSEALEFIARKG